MDTFHPASRSRRLVPGVALSAVVVAIAACGGSSSSSGNNNADIGATPTALNVLYVKSNHLTPGLKSVLDGIGVVLSRAGQTAYK